MAELVLLSLGWKAASFGINLPFETLRLAIERYQPRLFWLSCSYIGKTSEFLKGYRELYDQFGDQMHFVVGGSALTPDLRSKMSFNAFCEDLRHFEEYCESVEPITSVAAT